jgi:AcrR family transcriptional regulator
MRYKPEHRRESRARILKAVGRGFRSHGFAGIGVDGLAKEAGLTSGAFYGHFPSKSEAFRAALRAGLEELHQGIKAFQTKHGHDWVRPFVTFYLGTKRTCSRAETCALPTLSPEVERSDGKTQSVYDAELLTLATTISEGFNQVPKSERLDRAWAFLGLLAGGLTLSRAMKNKSAAEKIAASTIRAALDLSR